MPHPHNICDKTTFFAPSHRRTTPIRDLNRWMYHSHNCGKYQVFTSISRVKRCDRQRNFSPSRRRQKIAEGFFREAQRWQTASCRSKTQHKNTSFNTLHRHRQHLRSRNGLRPDPQMGTGGHFTHTKTLKWAFESPANGRKHTLQMKGAHFENIWCPQIPKVPIQIQKVGFKGSHFEFWRRPKSPQLAGHRVVLGWHPIAYTR